MTNLKGISKVVVILVLGFIIERSFMGEGRVKNSFFGSAWATEEQENQHIDSAENENTFDPHADIRVTKTHYVITMELPGFRKDEINVEVINKWQIVITGPQKKSKDDPGPQYHIQKRQSGAFTRNIILPDDAHTDEVDAEFKNGILMIHVTRADPIGSKTKVTRKRVEIK